MTKLQLGVAGALVATGAAGFVTQAEGNATLSNELARLRAENQTIAALHAENRRLAALAAEAAELRKDDAELARLRDEATALKAKLAARPAASVGAKIQPPPPASAARLADGATFAYDLSQLDQRPQPRFQARPEYPAGLRSEGVGGEAVVQFIVDAQGNVQNAWAVRSSRPEFAPAAVTAISKWTFKAGVKGGVPVNTRMQVPVVFTVKGGESAPAKPEPPPGY